MLEGPINTPKTVPVSLVGGNLIKCGSNGGNLLLKSKTGAGQPMQVTWQWVGTPAGQEFSLQFLPLPLEDDSDPNESWPFQGTAPPGGLTPPATEHTFLLKHTNIVCKYSVFVGSLHLDPVIIVEK
jgi:hypothetical protein